VKYKSTHFTRSLFIFLSTQHFLFLLFASGPLFRFSLFYGKPGENNKKERIFASLAPGNHRNKSAVREKKWKSIDFIVFNFFFGKFRIC
jgi:hypothetical protein